MTQEVEDMGTHRHGNPPLDTSGDAAAILTTLSDPSESHAETPKPAHPTRTPPAPMQSAGDEPRPHGRRPWFTHEAMRDTCITAVTAVLCSCLSCTAIVVAFVFCKELIETTCY